MRTRPTQFLFRINFTMKQIILFLVLPSLLIGSLALLSR